MVFLLSVSVVACGGGESMAASDRNLPAASVTPSRIASGKYPVQQASYNDTNGEYSLFLLNTPPGTPAVYRTQDLPMARLTEDELKAGEKSYLQVNNGEQSLHLSEDFKIEYVHAVTETRNDPQTGQPQTVVVRQESSFWTPFAGAIAGQMVANLLFTPHYYFPPVYQPGVALVGYGGYGRTYNQAVSSYQQRYQTPPPAVRNNFRTTGRIRTPGTRVTNPTNTRTTGRPTGSGFGSSTLRSSNKSNPSQVRKPSFGTGRSLGTRRSFSGGRRR